MFFPPVKITCPPAENVDETLSFKFRWLFVNRKIYVCPVTCRDRWNLFWHSYYICSTLTSGLKKLVTLALFRLANIQSWGDFPVLHCTSPLCMISVSLACINERVHSHTQYKRARFPPSYVWQKNKCSFFLKWDWWPIFFAKFWCTIITVVQKEKRYS